MQGRSECFSLGYKGLALCLVDASPFPVAREGKRLLQGGGVAAKGVGAKQTPVVRYPGVARTGNSVFFKDTFVGKVRSAPPS
jgi:hypothetical protein